MKKTKITQSPESEQRKSTQTSRTVSNSTAMPYIRDPDFQPYPPSSSPTGPGMALSGQEREIVRRLLSQWRLHPSIPQEALMRRLPNGVGLAPDQKQLLARLVAQAQSGEPGDIDALWDMDYQKQPPSMEQFINDDYYLGTILNEGLWPAWRSWLVENANLGSFLHELLITGAIGTGKTYVMVTLLLYRICLCGMLCDPYTFFGLSRGSSIVFLLLSLSRETLRATAWQTAVRLMAASPFFTEFCGFNPAKAHSDAGVLLRINAGTSWEVQITLSGGSKGQHQIGRNLLAVGFDESNYRLEKNPAEYAFDLFGDMRRRMVSRFQQIGSFMPGLSVVASSAAGESCFTEQLRQQIENEGDPNGQLVVRQAIYHSKPGLSLGSWWFKVFYGLPNVEPAILSGCYTESGQPIPPQADCPPEIAAFHEQVPQGARFELVPGNYYGEFVRSPFKGLQHLSGISLGASNRLFPTLADIQRCLELSAEEGVPVPTDATIISLSDENVREIWDDLCHRVFVRRVSQYSCAPIRHPNRLRYIHLDLATTGFAGIAICHLSDPVALQQAEDFSGNPPRKLIVEYDFILTLGPGKRRPICYDKILKFIFWLRNECGFLIGLVTADSFQSEHLLQTLHSRGIRTNRQSVDRDKRAYLAWQTAFQERCIRLYPQKQLLKEAAELIELETRIEHPPKGTKDATDAAAASFLSAISSDEVLTLCTPQAPPVVVGISLHSNASPDDPFGFFHGLMKQKRQIKTFDV